MAISTQQKIIRELARLRMWRQDGDPDELPKVTELAHNEINKLLDRLDQENSQSKANQCHTQPVT